MPKPTFKLDLNRRSKETRHCTVIVVERTRSDKRLPARTLALGNEAFDLLRARTGGNHECVGHVDDDQIVDAEACDEPPGAGDDDTTGGLVGKH
jgi:hypothetical protein